MLKLQNIQCVTRYFSFSKDSLRTVPKEDVILSGEGARGGGQEEAPRLSDAWNGRLPAFMTRKQLVKLLGLTYEQIKRLEYQGHLRPHPFFKREKRYSAEQVRAFVTA